MKKTNLVDIIKKGAVILLTSVILIFGGCDNETTTSNNNGNGNGNGYEIGTGGPGTGDGPGNGGPGTGNGPGTGGPGNDNGPQPCPILAAKKAHAKDVILGFPNYWRTNHMQNDIQHVKDNSPFTPPSEGFRHNLASLKVGRLAVTLRDDLQVFADVTGTATHAAGTSGEIQPFTINPSNITLQEINDLSAPRRAVASHDGHNTTFNFLARSEKNL